MEVAGRKGVEMVRQDEQPLKADPAKIPTLKAAFARDGAITAANASSISDGAAALVLMRASTAEALGLEPVARIAGHGVHAHAPSQFTTAPVPAMRQALERSGWSAGEVDLFEVKSRPLRRPWPMIAMRDLGIDRDQLRRQWRRLRSWVIP